MTHAKAALVDGETLLFGSVNFNVASWRSNGDHLAITRDPALVAAFEHELFEPCRTDGRLCERPELPFWRAWRSRASLRLADALLARLSFGAGPRVLRWPVRSEPAAADLLRPA